MDLDDPAPAPPPLQQPQSPLSSYRSSDLLDLLNASVAAASLARSSAAAAVARDAAKKRTVNSGADFESFESLVRTATLVPVSSREIGDLAGRRVGGGGGAKGIGEEEGAAATEGRRRVAETTATPLLSSSLLLRGRGFDAPPRRASSSNTTDFVLHLRRDGTPVLLR